MSRAEFPGDFPEFYEFTLYKNFVNFLKVAIPIMAIDVKNNKNHM